MSPTFCHPGQVLKLWNSSYSHINFIVLRQRLICQPDNRKVFYGCVAHRPLHTHPHAHSMRCNSSIRICLYLYWHAWMSMSYEDWMWLLLFMFRICLCTSLLDDGTHEKIYWNHVCVGSLQCKCQKANENPFQHKHRKVYCTTLLKKPEKTQLIFLVFTHSPYVYWVYGLVWVLLNKS